MPTRTGHSFQGWYSPAGNKVKETSKVTKTVTLTARWKANSYKVTFDPDGGTVKPASVTKTYGTAIGTLPTPKRTGHSFLGWYSPAGNKVKETSKVTKTVTLTAKWKKNSYKVTFDPKGGKVSTKSVTKAYGSKIGVLPTPKRTGYAFLGWYSPAGNKVKATSKVTKTVTLTARWKANTYKVTFDPKGGKVSTKSVTKAYGSKIGTLPKPTRAGYSFQGWYTASGTKVAATTKVTKDLALRAHWARR
jgi:uncharacterized repeat protein (TIGR02543 family)